MTASAELKTSRSESRDAAPGWSRYFLPSVTDLWFIILLLSLTVGVLAPRLLGDADTGWHIRNGELILQSHSITREDPFSALKSGERWYAWEWLFDVLIAGVHHWIGLNGVVLLAALVIAVTFTLTFRWMLARGASLLISLVFLVLALGASAIHLFARPHVFSWLLTLVWFELLDSWETGTGAAHSIYWLVPIMVLWVNLHGGFVLGFALCAIYLIAGLVRWRQSKGIDAQQRARSSFRRLAGATAASLVAGLANPNGYKLYLHVYQYLSDRFLMNHIDEFRSPDFHGAAQKCFAALLLIAIASFATAGRKLRLSQTLVVIFAVYSGLYASRNLPVSSILLCLVLAPLVSAELARTAIDDSLLPPLRHILSAIVASAERMGRLQARFRGHVWPAVVVLVLVTACIGHGQLAGRQIMSAHFDAKRFPVEAVNFMQSHSVRDPILSEDYWGGYLIYRLYPENRVFMDDRHDFYGDTVLKSYLRIMHVEPGWDAELDKLDPRWILLPPQSTLANILREVPAWKVVYEDKTAVLFEKSGTGTVRQGS
ncbi:MAG TPA: hypothetical protein VJQ82_14825 [Terriglobales bacterium]|nr:hypothetical protein [Terriglobales bacterium]